MTGEWPRRAPSFVACPVGLLAQIRGVKYPTSLFRGWSPFFFLVDDYCFIITYDICCIYNKIFILLILIRRFGLGNFSICCINKSLIYYLKLISWEVCSVTLLYHKYINGPSLATSVQASVISRQHLQYTVLLSRSQRFTWKHLWY